MRFSLLAVLAVVVLATPAIAQNRYPSRTPSRTAEYASKAAPYRYAAETTHVESLVESQVQPGYGCTSCGGCDACQTRCCRPAILPNLLDNIQDAFLGLMPRRGAHCCPYPPSCTAPSCTAPRFNLAPRCRQPILNALFPCSKGCCQSSCGCAAPAAGCGCTAGEIHGMDLMSPPRPQRDLEDTPFKDDPEVLPPSFDARKSHSTKTTSTPNNWYKTRTAPAPSYYDEFSPQTIIVGRASPITVGN